MHDKAEWRYIYCNSEFVNDFSEFKKKLLKRTFHETASSHQESKAVLRLGYIIRQRDESSYRINLRISCFLDDNKRISTQLFASFSGDDPSAFQYFQRNCDKKVEVEFAHRQITYLSTKELYSFTDMNHFINAIDQFERLPNDLYQEIQGACTLACRENLSSERTIELKAVNSELKLLRQTNELLEQQVSLQAQAISSLEEQVSSLKSKELSDKRVEHKESSSASTRFF